MRKSINDLFNGSKSRADRAITFLLAEDLIYQPEGSKLYWIVDSSMDSSSNTESPENLNQGPELDSSVDTVNGDGEGVLGSRSFRTGPMDPAPPTEPDKSLKENNRKNTLEEGEDQTDFEGGEITPREAKESNVILGEEELIEAISALGYDEGKTEILQTIALIIWHDPNIVRNSPYSSRDMQDKITSLAEIEGVEVSEKDYDIALGILVNRLSFINVLKERMKRVS